MFPTFPQFKALGLADKKGYEVFMHPYPPYSDLSFSTLMIWWNFANDLEVSKLHNNLVLRYHLPSDPENSGVSLIGANNMDESMTALLDELERRGEPARLIHVPQFVVDAIKEPTRFSIEEELDYAEYLFPTDHLYPLGSVNPDHRRCVIRFYEQMEGHRLEIRELDMCIAENAELLLSNVEVWDRDAHNDPEHNEQVALQYGFAKSESLALQNKCVFIDGKLAGFIIFQVSHDGQYVIADHIKCNRDVKHLNHYLEYLLARTANQMEVPFINMEMDLGITGLRYHKAKMQPTDFFRKYRITYAAKL